MAGQFVATRASFYAKGELQSLEDIQSLIESEYGAIATQEEPTRYHIRLAANQAGVLNVNVYGTWDCNGAIGVAPQSSVTKYTVNLVDTAKEAAPYYQTVALVIGASELPSLTTERTLIYDRLDIYEHLKWLAGQNGIYHDGDTLFSIGIPFQVEVDGVNLARTATVIPTKLMTATTTRLRSTLVSPVQLSDRLATPYFGPYRDHVILSPIRDNTMVGYAAPGCTISNAAITYVRKPRPISLILGSQTDLTDNGKVHELLCKMTVTDLMGDAADDRYVISLQNQIKAFDNRPA
jgi:hypothetical protein